MRAVQCNCHELTDSLVHSTQFNLISKDMVFVHLHLMTIKSAYVRHRVKLSDSDNVNSVDPLSDEEDLALTQLFTAKSVYNTHQALNASSSSI